MSGQTDFHSNLTDRRKALGLTQEQLAQRLNVSSQAVSKWEKGRFPDAALLPQIAEALDISLDALFGLGVQDHTEPETIVCRHLQSLPPEKRPQWMAHLLYALLCSYSPSADLSAIRLRSGEEAETYGVLHTDHEIALERLNADLRYFMYLEKPAAGVAAYLQDEKGIVRLLSTLGDADAVRMIRYMAGNCRNKLFLPAMLAEKLNIPTEKVQQIMNRLDRFGLVWRMAGDFNEASPTILYGYTHNPAVAMLLVLAQSICNYLKTRDPNIDRFTYGSLQDQRNGDPKQIPQVSEWDADSL